MPKVLTRCPVCDNALRVTELACSHCATSVRGEFATCRFCRLTPEHLGFIEIFLRCEGNLSRVEKELNLSYPTVRNKFAAALAALHLDDEARNAAEITQTTPVSADYERRRREILNEIAQGTLTAEEAAETLRTLQGTGRREQGTEDTLAR